MPGTYTNLLYHIIFSTKRRTRIIMPEFESQLHAYMGGIILSMNGVARSIGGVADHMHLVLRWRTDESLAALVRTVKARSSAWVHRNHPQHRSFAWQEGFAGFTVSHSQSSAVEQYIVGQAEHHRVRTFEEELRAFLRQHQVAFDERYLLG